MVRSSLFVRALGVAIGVPLVGGLTFSAPTTQAAQAAPPPPAPARAASASAAPAQDPEPLAITIDTMSPATVPRTGPITLTGTVTNVDTETWSTINLYPFIGSEPMTTEAELREAVGVPVDQDVGGRFYRDVPLDQVGELSPGESYDYTIVVPRSYYTVASAGVYWFGVHALAEGPVARDQVADGRARTFLPYIPANAQGEIKTALVVPLRRYVGFEPDGSVANADDWERTLSSEGRLRSLVDFGTAAGSAPLTWLVDPALPDVVQRLAAGNPGRSLAPTLPPDAEDPVGEESDDPSPSVTVTPEPDPEADPEVEPDPEAAAAAAAAGEWLADLRSVLGGDQVLSLPYGDPDAAAAGDHGRELFELAVTRPGAVLSSWQVDSTPALGSPSGYLSPDGISLATPATTTLLTDRMFGASPPAVAESDGARLVVLSSGAAAGGPPPGNRHSTIALRQRILSEAAVRMVDTGDRPLVMMLPVDWRPDDLAGFFTGLQVDWLELTTVGDASDRAAAPVDPARLTYPKRQVDRELGAANFESAEDLVAAGNRLQNLLTRNDQVASSVTDQALTGVSYGVREAPRSARTAARRSQAWIEERLRSVQVDAPLGVTLSGGSGSFLATVSNKLDEPVTVVVTATTDRGIEVADSGPLRLGPDSQLPVEINVETRRAGVHEVTLHATDIEGGRLGSSDVVPIRSAQVSTVIWVIMASGAGILFLAVGVRLVRRFRHRHDPEPVAEPEPVA